MRGLFYSRDLTRADLLLQVLHLTLQRADIARHLRPEGIELRRAVLPLAVVQRAAIDIVKQKALQALLRSTSKSPWTGNDHLALPLQTA